MDDNLIYDVIIAGAGPAGLTAGIYTSRGKLKTLVIEKAMVGGLPLSTDMIENYPGFPEGISGIELMKKMKDQAERFGTKIVNGDIKSVKKAGEDFEVVADRQTYRARSVIIATGTTPKSLKVPGEEKLRGRGVSYCATCDGPFFRNQDIAVIGCGNSGVQEGLFLLKFVRSITFVEFMPRMSAEKILQERIKKDKRTSFLLNHELISINGENTVESIRVKDRQDGSEKEIKVSGVFIYVGFLPGSDFVRGTVELDRWGYIVTDEKMATSVPGIFAAGDVRAKEVRQVTNAVGEGTVAAIMAEKYLDSLNG